MSKVHAQMALFGALDEFVTQTDDPRIRNTVEAFLPGTTGIGQRGWYAELRRFLNKNELAPRDETGAPLPRAGPVTMPGLTEAVAQLTNQPLPGQPAPADEAPPTPDVMARSIFAATVFNQLIQTAPPPPLTGWVPGSADPLSTLLPMAGRKPGSTPLPQPAPPAPGAQPLLEGTLHETLANVTNRHEYEASMRALALAGSDEIDPEIGGLPVPCTGALRRVGGQFCSVLTTDWDQPNLTLAQMRRIIDPNNWPHLCDFFVSMTPQTPLTPDPSRGWSRVLETVSGDETQWQMRTALKYWKGVNTPDEGIYINYDLDHPRIGDDPLVEVDAGYIWITPIVPGNPDSGVRIRTSKAVRIRGLSPTATAALGCFCGWGDAASQMLVAKAKNPEHDCTDFEPSVDSGVVLRQSSSSKPASGSSGMPSTADLLKDAEDVELLDGWRGALIDNVAAQVGAFIEKAAPLADDLLTRWSDGISVEDVREFGQRAGSDMTDYAVSLYSAAADALRPPAETPEASEG